MHVPCAVPGSHSAAVHHLMHDCRSLRMTACFGKHCKRAAAHATAQTFWHSSAHVLGEALEACFGVRLTIGPAVEEGFYYDCYMGDRTLTDAEKPALEKKIEQARQPALAHHRHHSRTLHAASSEPHRAPCLVSCRACTPVQLSSSSTQSRVASSSCCQVCGWCLSRYD